jgi:hypothetical protein
MPAKRDEACMSKLEVDVDLLCRRIGLAVSPVRASSFEILSRLMLAAMSERQEADAEALAPLFEGFAACCEMLESGVPAAFAEIGQPPPPALAEARGAALAAARETFLPLRALARGGAPASPAAFRDLAKRIERDLRPAIGAFLGALNDFARAEADRRRAETRGLVASTIAEVERFSLAIKLISINASVESAHAGEAGRGFAVIASEIRALSDKSKDALDFIRSKLV